MPKISVVIPAYNAMAYLPQTMETVLNQTFDDLEVLVVNDGSLDGTEEWVSQIKDSRVKLICQENKGLSGARNTGIKNAEGEYIAFLDADDLWEATKLEKQANCLDNNPEVALVYTWTALINQQGISTGRVFANHAEGNVWEALTQRNLIECGSVAMVRRCCFETVGVFDQNLLSYVEDWDMWLRIATSYPFKVIKEALVYYRQHSTSASKNWTAMEKSFCMVIEKAFQDAPEHLQYLKSRSYGCANLCLAWKPLQSQQKDFRQAIYYRQQALRYYPQLRFSKEYIRLSLAIALMRYFGTDSYSKVLEVVYAWRRHIA